MFIEESIRENVEKLIRKHGTSNPEEIIANMKNVDFKYEPLSDNINGYYLYVSEKKQMLRVNENLEDRIKLYVLFHELAHIILKHRGVLLFDNVTKISSLKEEYEADLTATYFFILHNGINRENVSDFTFPERAKRYVGKFIY